MPTNFVRSRKIPTSSRPAAGREPSRVGSRDMILSVQVGGVQLRIRLLGTPTTQRLWMMLPLFSTAEPWGDVIHFEIPVEIGRDRTARVNARPGEVYLWAEEDRILLPFGATPLSKGNEMRLPWPCNVLGDSLDDMQVLSSVRVGEKVTLSRWDV